MLQVNWFTKIGYGVIDTALAEKQEKVVAGDVNGNVFLVDYKGQIQKAYRYDIPVWGVDVSDDAKYISVGLASKQPSRGSFILVDTEIDEDEKHNIKRKDTTTAVWDVKFIPGEKKVYATTWGEGLIELDFSNLEQAEFDTTSFRGNLFGLSVTIEKTETKGKQLFITAAGEGIYSLELSSTRKLELISKSPIACYNNYFESLKGRIFYGSSEDILSVHDTLEKTDRHYRIVSNSMCSMAVFADQVIFGDLVGNLYISPSNHPHVPYFHTKFPGSIWNVSVDVAKSLLFIACGDGNLYCCNISDRLKDRMIVSSNGASSSEKNTIDREKLKGVKIFLSYASEDEESARLLYNNLRTFGCEPWMDKESLLPGQDWKYEIRKAIKESEFFLICLSKKSVTKRGFIQKEIKHGLDVLDQMPEGEIFLIPIRLDDCEVPDSMSDRQWVDLFSEDGLYKLITAIYVQVTKANNEDVSE